MKNLYLLLVLVLTQTFLFAECLDGPGSADIAACTNFDGDDLCDIDVDDCVLDTFGLCGNGNSMQGAIHAASNGDTILVPSGTYTESILIMKTLIKGEN